MSIGSFGKKKFREVALISGALILAACADTSAPHLAEPQANKFPASVASVQVLDEHLAGQPIVPDYDIVRRYENEIARQAVSLALKNIDPVGGPLLMRIKIQTVEIKIEKTGADDLVGYPVIGILAIGPAATEPRNYTGRIYAQVDEIDRSGKIVSGRSIVVKSNVLAPKSAPKGEKDGIDRIAEVMLADFQAELRREIYESR